MFEIEDSKTGIKTIKYNNRYIHSKYDPKREAENFANGNLELIKKPVITLYGLGLGYHIIEIAKKMKEDSILYVFEWNDELVEYCKKYNNSIFNYKNIKIIGNDDPKFYEKMSNSINESKDILIHRPSLEIISDSNETLYNLINDYSLIKQFTIADDTYDVLGKENFKVNIEKKYPLINSYIQVFKNNEKPYIVTSSGPSLDNELELLKRNRKNFNIISVGSSLKAVMEHNIKPDSIVITDAKKIVMKQLEGFRNEDIPLCFSANASKEAVEYYEGPKYIFNSNDDNEIEIENRCTVAISAIDIAIKSGAKVIILLGQDLAFINGKSHTETFERVYGFKDNVKNNNKRKTIKGINGEILETTQGFITFRNQIESLISNNKKIKFINCSKGAYIKGAEHMSFTEYIEEHIK